MEYIYIYSNPAPFWQCHRFKKEKKKESKKKKKKKRKKEKKSAFQGKQLCSFQKDLPAEQCPWQKVCSSKQVPVYALGDLPTVPSKLPICQRPTNPQQPLRTSKQVPVYALGDLPTVPSKLTIVKDQQTLCISKQIPQQLLTNLSSQLCIDKNCAFQNK